MTFELAWRTALSEVSVVECWASVVVELGRMTMMIMSWRMVMSKTTGSDAI
jgi:hypothetical protein